VSYFNKTVASKDMSGYYLLKNGEFAYNKSYSVGYDFGSIKRLDRYRMGALSTLYICFVLKRHESDFIKAYFDSLKWYREIYMISAEGARNHGLLNVPTEEFFDTKHYLPENTDEQRKIANFLIAIDKRIAAQQSLIDNLKKYKRGVMQRIFRNMSILSPSGFETVQLSAIFKKVSRRNSNGEIKNVITNSAEYGLIPQRDFFDKDIAVDGNTSNYYVIEHGDFVYNPRKSNTAPYGPFNRYEREERGIISPLYTCLVLQADIEPSYLAWYFKSDAWYRYIYDNGSQGVRHDRVSMTDDLLMGIPVIIPSKEAQLKIANLLDCLESRFQTELSQYESLKSIRVALLQQLFI
jgi:type I restriction enzyme S subunit